MYAWSQATGPAVEINRADQPTATFVAPPVRDETRFEFFLTVTDPAGNTATDRVPIYVRPGVNAGGSSGSVGLPFLMLALLAGYRKACS